MCSENPVVLTYVVTPYRFWFPGWEEKNPQKKVVWVDVSGRNYFWLSIPGTLWWPLFWIGKDLVLDWKRPCFEGAIAKNRGHSQVPGIDVLMIWREMPAISCISRSLVGSNIWRHVCDVEFSMANEWFPHFPLCLYIWNQGSIVDRYLTIF